MERTWKPTTAGILNIISGASGIASGIFLMGVGGMISGLSGVDCSDWIEKWGGGWGPGPGPADIPEMLPEVIGFVTAISMIVGIVLLAFGIITLVGGIYAIKRRKWGLALAGSILALPVGGILGLLAIIFVSLGKKEFD